MLGLQKKMIEIRLKFRLGISRFRGQNHHRNGVLNGIIESNIWGILVFFF